MTIEELEAKCDIAEALESERGPKRGSKSAPFIVLTIPRACKGARVRVAPGLYGQILRWGDKEDPTVFSLDCGEVRAWIKKVREEQTKP